MIKEILKTENLRSIKAILSSGNFRSLIEAFKETIKLTKKDSLWLSNNTYLSTDSIKDPTEFYIYYCGNLLVTLDPIYNYFTINNVLWAPLPKVNEIYRFLPIAIESNPRYAPYPFIERFWGWTIDIFINEMGCLENGLLLPDKNPCPILPVYTNYIGKISFYNNDGTPSKKKILESVHSTSWFLELTETQKEVFKTVYTELSLLALSREYSLVVNINTKKYATNRVLVHKYTGAKYYKTKKLPSISANYSNIISDILFSYNMFTDFDNMIYCYINVKDINILEQTNKLITLTKETNK